MGQSAAERSARYRAKDVDAYRAQKNALAKQQKHREKRRLYMQGWRERNRDRHNDLARQSHHRNKHKHVEKNRERALKTLYGLTASQYEAILSTQGGGCRLCGKPPGVRRLSVDHCHTTGRIRGVLCVSCNTTLGRLEQIGIERVIAYLT